MDFSQYTVVLNSNSVIVGGQTDANQTQAETQQPAANSFFGGGSGSFSLTQWIVIYVIIIAAAYFITALPQRKREKKIKELQDSIKIGDDVVTAGGFHGKVVDTGDGVYVLEFGTNKGIRIPVNKADVFPVKNKGAAEKTEN